MARRRLQDTCVIFSDSSDLVYSLLVTFETEPSCPDLASVFILYLQPLLRECISVSAACLARNMAQCMLDFMHRLGKDSASS